MFSFLQGVVVTRALGPSQYGQWGLIVSFTGLVRSFLGFRTQESLTRYLVEFKIENQREKIRTLMQAALIVDFLVSVISVGIMVIGFKIYGRYSGADKIAFHACDVFSITMLLSFTNAAFFSVSRDAGFYGWIGFLPSVLAAVQAGSCGMLALTHDLNLTTITYVYFVTSFFQCAFQTAFVLKVARSRYQISLWTFSIASFKSARIDLQGFWKFMRATYWATTASTFLKNGDMLVLGIYADHANVGVYRLAKSLVAVIQSLTTSMSTVIYQDFNEDLRRKRGGIADKMWRLFLTRWFPIMVLVSIISIVGAKFLIGIIFSRVYADAWIPFGILMVGTMIAMSLFWVQPLTLSLGHYSQYLRASVWSSVGAMVAMLVLVQKFKGNGVAIGFSVAWAGSHLYLLSSVLKNDSLKSAHA